jgi:hypothetical protein
VRNDRVDLSGGDGVIVDPDFLDHWRTGMVVDALADPMAPLYILRLWAHCQERRSDTFVMPARGVKSQCKCPADADVFEAALIEAGFLQRDGATITVLGWSEKNASLLAAWKNGIKGGRPKKNPDETPGKPTGNPARTQPEPTGNPDETDKRREEKNSPSLRSGEDPARKRAAPAPVEIVPASTLVAAGFDARTALDFIAHKAAHKAPLTPRAWADHQREALKAGWTPVQAAEKVMAKSWKGFEAKYVRDEQPPARHGPLIETFRQRDERDAAEKVAFLTGRMPGNGAARPAQADFIDAEVTDVTPRQLG